MPTKEAGIVKTYDARIGGRWVQARSGATRDIHDPANGELLAKVPECGREDAVAAIAAARAAFDGGPWRKTGAQDRGKLLFKIGNLLIGRSSCRSARSLRQ